MALPKRHFLDWESPLATSVAEWVLASAEKEESCYLLEDYLIIAPTKQAGRRLRETLATLAEKEKFVVIPPHVVTPDFLVDPSHQKDIVTANPIDEYLIWKGILNSLEVSNYKALFPNTNNFKNESWITSTIKEIRSVRRTLGESGLTISGVVDSNTLEKNRWKEFSNLEAIYHQQLKKLSLMDREEARAEFSRAPYYDNEYKKVIIAATPDPLPISIEALKNFDQISSVEVLVWSPEILKENFDEWGRPNIDYWSESKIEINDFDESVHKTLSVENFGDLGAELASQHSQAFGTVSFGIGLIESIASIRRKLERVGINSFDPSGIDLTKQPILEVLRCLSQCLSNETFDSLSKIVRLPIIAQMIVRGSETKEDDLLSAVDLFIKNHCPDLIQTIQPLVKDDILILVLEWWENWKSQLSSKNGVDGILLFLQEAYQEQEYQTNLPVDRIQLDSIKGCLKVLEEIQTSLERNSTKLNTKESLALLLYRVKTEKISEEKLPESIDLHGWLELLWEDSPHLIITGMNEGTIPDLTFSDSYLPNSLRESLNLRSNEDRIARDSYILTALTENRKHQKGRIDYLYSETKVDGTPARPSGFFYRCQDNEIAERVFSELKSDPFSMEVPAKSWNWKFNSPSVPADHKIKQSISITKLRDYLTCPYRFYLKNILSITSNTSSHKEMDALQLGTFIHRVIERYGKNEDINTTADPRAIFEYFKSEWNKIITINYGKFLPLTIEIQKQSIEQKFLWLSEIEANSRNEGWQIIPEFVETNIEIPLSNSLITGVVDRVERNSNTGEYRVLDLKTGTSTLGHSKNQEVFGAHLRKLKTNEQISDLPTCMVYENESETYVWKNLQLPLYHIGLGLEGDSKKAGYIVLANSRRETQYLEWDDIEKVLASAQKCAQGIIKMIDKNKFWPPVEKVNYDDFKALSFKENLESEFDQRDLKMWK